jgi:hypothetical protein
MRKTAKKQRFTRATSVRAGYSNQILWEIMKKICAYVRVGAYIFKEGEAVEGTGGKWRD